MKKFCKDIGLDKRTLLTMLLGEGKEVGHNSSRKDQLNSISKDLGSSIAKESGGIVNTGIAAQMAYNNIIMGNDPDKDSNTSGV